MPHKRIFIYSHDTYGLGHLRRCLLLAERLIGIEGRPTILIATGSPRALSFELPRGCDTLKLPCLTKESKGRYTARDLSVPVSDVLRVRAEILRAAARAFQPDMILVDHAPVGVEGELQMLLDDVCDWPKRPVLVAGLRDIIDDAPVVRREWTRLNVWHYLENVYNQIVVYGDETLPTTAVELDLAGLYPGRVHSVGYLTRDIPSRLKVGETPTVLVTTGGGGDGQEILRAYVDYLESLKTDPGFRSILVTGPLLSRRRRLELKLRLAAQPAAVTVIEFTDELESLLGSASAVIAMGGYNTVAEILAAEKPALIVPREFPRLEQKLRAERLQGRSGIRVADVDSLKPAVFADFLHDAFHGTVDVTPHVDRNGLTRFTELAAGWLNPPVQVETPREFNVRLA